MLHAASGAQEELRSRGSGRLNETRRRRRSRSLSVRAGKSRQSEPGEVDLTLYMGRRKLLKLSEEDKEKLRNIMRKEHKQKHFIDSSAASAASGEAAAVPDREEIIRTNRARSALWPRVFEDANPIPSAEEFVEGMQHHNSAPEYKDEKFNVVRAIASTKVHYWKKMEPMLTNWPFPVFNSQYPHLDTADGVRLLTSEAWYRIQCELKVDTEYRYVLHLLNKHEGEARFVGEEGWYKFPASDGVQPWNARFWNYQFVETYDVRKWLYGRSQESWSEEDLTWSEILWIMEAEGGKTKVLKWVDDQASGGHWYMKGGNYITLAEIFYIGMESLSCYDLYRAYKCLPIFTHKRAHSESHSPEATMRSNAKKTAL